MTSLQHNPSDEALGALLRTLLERSTAGTPISTRAVLNDIITACDAEIVRTATTAPTAPTAHTATTILPAPSMRSSPIPMPTSPPAPSSVAQLRAGEVSRRRASHIIPPPTSPLPTVAAPSPVPLLPMHEERAPLAPHILAVCVPDKPGVEAEYTLLGQHNGAPMWGAGARRLYSTRAGYWMLTATAGGAARDVGLVETLHPHGGVHPHLVHEWQAFDGVSWRRAGVAVSAVGPVAEEGRGHEGGFRRFVG